MSGIITATPKTAAPVLAVPVKSMADLAGLLRWAEESPDISCTVSAPISGPITVQLEGVTVATRSWPLADLLGGWIVFNSKEFSAISDTDFAAGYDSSQPLASENAKG